MPLKIFPHPFLVPYTSTMELYGVDTFHSRCWHLLCTRSSLPPFCLTNYHKNLLNLLRYLYGTIRLYWTQTESERLDFFLGKYYMKPICVSTSRYPPPLGTMVRERNPKRETVRPVGLLGLNSSQASNNFSSPPCPGDISVWTLGVDTFTLIN